MVPEALAMAVQQAPVCRLRKNHGLAHSAKSENNVHEIVRLELSLTFTSRSTITLPLPSFAPLVFLGRRREGGTIA
jgi:hypothetical protein